MTAEQTPPEAVAGEKPPSRAAIGCLAVIGASFAGTIVVVVPETAYCIAGFMAAATARKARTWAAGRRSAADEEQMPDAEPVDIVAVLYDLSAGGEHVRLTQLAEAAGLPDTKTVRTLLDEAGIRVRAGVRTSGGNGPGVHMADIPALKAAPSDGCLCSSTANANANNDDGEEPREGLRVAPIGQAGTVVHDPTETKRRRAAITR